MNPSYPHTAHPSIQVALRLSMLLLVLLGSKLTSAQKNPYSTESSRAIRWYEESGTLVDREPGKAIEILNKATAEDPKFIEAHMRLGDVYANAGMEKEALESYNRVLALDSQFNKRPYMAWGQFHFAHGRYDEALLYFTRYADFDRLSHKNRTEADYFIASCHFAREAVKKPVPFKPVSLGPKVNSPDPEYLPTITADGKTLIVTRKTPYGEDFYESQLGPNGWSQAIPVKGAINTPQNEGAQCISNDGRLLFYTGCNRRGGLGSCDIYLSVKNPTGWGDPTNLGRPVNSDWWESQPSFSRDGRTLYFASDRPGGQGKIDIWKSEYRNGIWSDPVNLGPTINSPGNEQCPFIHPDDQTLYFSSDGHPGMGSKDIFLSRRQDDSSWGIPVNLGYPINTFNEESSLIVSLDGSTAYFASDRFDTRGNLDLYSFELYPEARPLASTFVRGYVFDELSKKPLVAQYELFELKTDRGAGFGFTPPSGKFLNTLTPGETYALNVSKEGYLFYSAHFAPEAGTRLEPFEIQVPMTPIKEGARVVLRNIFFDFDKSTLQPESKPELEKLIQFLNGNPKVKIRIEGHTDGKGSEEYNLNLSRERAAAVKKYLEKAGIEATRVESVGFGKSQPVADNETEEGRAQNRRTEFRITGVQ